jgi:hypothetical protein
MKFYNRLKEKEKTNNINKEKEHNKKYSGINKKKNKKQDWQRSKNSSTFCKKKERKNKKN